MRTKLSMILVSLFIGVSDSKAQQTDQIDAVAIFFRTSDASKISEEFSSTLVIHILSEGSVYSKAQAKQILRNFFLKNKPVSVKIIHRLNSNPNYKLAVLSMVTLKNKFRISLSLSNSSNRFLIKEMRIEYDKE